MKKYIKIIGISVLCIALIVGYYYYLSHKDKKNVENNTEVSEVEEVLMKDLEKDYPPTPREVIKFYNRILACLYNEEYSESQFEELAEQARGLLDTELLNHNPKEVYLTSLKAEVEEYKEKKQTLADTTVSNTNEIEYKKVDGKECAYVTASYFMKEGNSYSRTYQEYILRKGTEKDWRIVGYQLVKGDSSK
ncbi:MAG: hypothetical protein HFI37_07685 [Lachnospiraceae bacterium]|nr:hypothetical protein [Lachnospiraceae bacterium]